MLGAAATGAATRAPREAAIADFGATGVRRLQPVPRGAQPARPADRRVVEHDRGEHRGARRRHVHRPLRGPARVRARRVHRRRVRRGARLHPGPRQPPGDDGQPDDRLPLADAAAPRAALPWADRPRRRPQDVHHRRAAWWPTAAGSAPRRPACSSPSIPRSSSGCARNAPPAEGRTVRRCDQRLERCGRGRNRPAAVTLMPKPSGQRLRAVGWVVVQRPQHAFVAHRDLGDAGHPGDAVAPLAQRGERIGRGPPAGERGRRGDRRRRPRRRRARRRATGCGAAGPAAALRRVR